MRAVWIAPAIPSETVGVAAHRALGVVESRPWSRQELASGASIIENKGGERCRTYVSQSRG